ncbi:MAG TPA: adenylate/guanylate cyclase domain-containing protein [Xanthobacteraceae bacterium]|nr:adenylate/guanylate cyclase domain-containing protein [Xanthobacteraceae bacterium]
MKGIAEWLASIGLSEYAQRFADNAIDLSIVRDLTEQDLKDLGVLLGHRRKFLRAIAELDGAAPAPTETATEPVLRDDAERRHLTVMICDLVGSTALSARLDPEDMRAVIDAYHAACARITRTYDGFLAEFRGDGILAYFGYPLAHEDDAERTVRAGLDIIAAVARLETRAAETLAVRIGIATGVVVIGDLSREGALREHAVVGETPNLAARLQALAEPGTIVVAGSTRRLLGDLFRLRDLGQHELKGIAEPVAMWAVEGVSDSDSRFEAVRAAGLTDLIGREAEIDFLLERQRVAWKGEGQIVLISGEPGIGKSRLTAALAERIASAPHTRLRYQCSPYDTNSALRPFITQLERAAGFKADDTSEQRLDKLEAVLAMGASRIEGVAPLFAALLSIPFGERYPPLALSPTQQRRRTLAALLDQFEGLARRQPILLSFEDAQWADATSLELLDLMVERVRQLPVLALFIFRPEFEPPWVGLPNVGTLTLGRLDRSDVENMVARVTGGRVLPAEVMKQIVTKTDGNPLFVEELTKTVLEAGILVENGESYRLDGPLPPLAIPATLQDSLMSRLDRLAPVKEIGQIGAVIGRDFSYSLLRAVVGRDETALKHALAQLEQAELVFRHGEPPEEVYSFKHALVRDAAYESLLKSRRQQLHGQIARALEERFAEIVASQPEIAAHHFTEAGLVELAIDYWLKAGQHAARRSANAEALNHFARGLDLLPNIDDPMVRNKSELLLQTSLGHSLRSIKGWSIDSVKQAYTRALQLCKESGFDEHTLPAVFGLWTWNFLRAPLGEAQNLAEQLVNTAENADDSVFKVLAHEALGFTLFARGKFAAAHAALERSISMCEDSKAAVYLDLSAQDPRVHVRLYDGMALWFLGYPDQALRICAEARRYADTSQHPFSEAMARTISLRVHQFRGEAAIVARQADAAITLCEEHGFVHYLAMALILRGWATAQQGEFEKGVAEIQGGLEKERATNALLFETYTLGLLADACIKNERYEHAFDFLNQAQLRLDEADSERFYAAEIYRLLGETYLRSRQELDQAERYLCKGLKVAREQKAKSLELKLCTSIYDLYELRQNADKYRSQLGEIYGSFSEGFDTMDLVRAKARLKNA